MKATHLVIDGKNALYRAIYAGYYDPIFKKSGKNYFVIFMRFLNNYLTLFRPDSMHIFWDTPKDLVWRKAIYPEYKDHRSAKHEDLNIGAEINRQVITAIRMLSWMGCRQYYRDRMEADDLIYAFCYLIKEPTVIVSSDQDLRQITYKMEYTSIYNPLAKYQQVEPRPTDDIVIVKSLMGDASDNIRGYWKVGPKKACAMAADSKLREDFLSSDKAQTMVEGEIKTVGESLFKRNRKLIDLSWCPELNNNCEYIDSKMKMPVRHDKQKVEVIAIEGKIAGLLSDIPRYLGQFSRLK